MLVFCDNRRGQLWAIRQGFFVKLVFELRVIEQKESREPGPRREHFRSQGLPCVLATQRPLPLAPGKPGRSLGEVGGAGGARCWWGVRVLTEGYVEGFLAIT